jgi:hypothetical protein
MNKLSSYQKLKQEKDNLFRLYYRARKRLQQLNQGIEGDDILLGFEHELIKKETNK